MERVNVSLREDQVSNLKLISKLSGRSVSAIIRKLIDDYEEELVKAVRRLERREKSGGFL